MMNSQSIAFAMLIGMILNFGCCLMASIYWGTW